MNDTIRARWCHGNAVFKKRHNELQPGIARQEDCASNEWMLVKMLPLPCQRMLQSFILYMVSLLFRMIQLTCHILSPRSSSSYLADDQSLKFMLFPFKATLTSSLLPLIGERREGEREEIGELTSLASREYCHRGREGVAHRCPRKHIPHVAVWTDVTGGE